ncbi:MAG: 4-hydroxy-3-methylbut-2-enyl diphosphate reductase, partial [Treponema sp.]|nr:4-hydroxy-3-methylbut-2-enyl diphosphate reductase [Treponema sp.]
MKVIRAGISGFCMGVRRAVELAMREASHGGRNVYTLGPLIHNPAVLETLAGQGIKVLKEGECPGDPKASAVIIRAHGIRPDAERELVRLGVTVLDATCPHVKANQKKAGLLSSRGVTVFLAGEREHAEIIGIRGYVQGPCYSIANPAEAEAAASELARTKSTARTALIGQTTISPEEYSAIGSVIKRYFP